jgi:hypothetical protein
MIPDLPDVAEEKDRIVPGALYGSFKLGDGTTQGSDETVWLPFEQFPVFGRSNVPRIGSNGLPREWTMDVKSWFARANRYLDDAFFEVAGKLVAELLYRDALIDQKPLLELLVNPVNVRLRMGECVPYGTRVSCRDVQTLRAHPELGNTTIWMYLYGDIRRAVF